MRRNQQQPTDRPTAATLRSLVPYAHCTQPSATTTAPSRSPPSYSSALRGPHSAAASCFRLVWSAIQSMPKKSTPPPPRPPSPRPPATTRTQYTTADVVLLGSRSQRGAQSAAPAPGGGDGGGGDSGEAIKLHGAITIILKSNLKY